MRKVIFDELTAHGRPTTTDEIDRALASILAVAFERLPRKPERWTLHGWLAWTARREIRRAAPA